MLDIPSPVQEVVSAFMGQRSSLPHGMLESTDCEKIENFVTRNARLRKIWGTTLYHTAGFGDGEIKWLDYFRNRWLFQRANGIGLETEEGSGEVNQLGTIFGGERRRVFSDKWIDSVFISNGYENKFVDFVTGPAPQLLNLGILPPGGGILEDSQASFVPANFTLVADAGSGLAAGDYEYLLTLWDEDRKIESMPYGSFVGEDGLWLYDASTPISGVDIRNYTTGINGIRINVPAANFKVAIDVAPILALGYDAARVTHYIIYRKAADGVYKRVWVNLGLEVDITPIGTTVFYDTIPSASLGTVIDFSLSPPPGGKYYRDSLAVEAKDYGPKFVKYHRDQLWLFGVEYPGTENGYESGKPIASTRFYPYSGFAYASAAGEFDYWQYTYGIGRETGKKDTFMGKHGNTLMFFKETSSYYLDGTSPENYEVREMDRDMGIVASGSGCETSRGIIGLGEGGFTLFDGVSKGKSISDEINDMVEKINLDYADKITSSFDPEEEKYECHCPIENGHNTLVFVYDLKASAWSFTKRAGGAAHYGLTSNKRTVGMIGDRLNGRLFLSTNRGVVTQNGQTMHGIWRSKQFDFRNPTKIKTLQCVTIVARAKRDFRLSIDVIADFAQKDCVTIEDIDPDVREEEFDEEGEEGAWDAAQWEAGSVKKEFTILVQAQGKKLQLVVRNSDTDADRANFEIEEITLLASLEDGDED